MKVVSKALVLAILSAHGAAQEYNVSFGHNINVEALIWNGEPMLLVYGYNLDPDLPWWRFLNPPICTHTVGLAISAVYAYDFRPCAQKESICLQSDDVLGYYLAGSIPMDLSGVTLRMPNGLLTQYSRYDLPVSSVLTRSWYLSYRCGYRTIPFPCAQGAGPEFTAVVVKPVLYK